jgi:hypothetical protein
VADQVAQFLMDVLRKQPDPLHQKRLDRGIPPELSLVVLKALEKNPSERYANAKELLRALEKIEL